MWLLPTTGCVRGINPSIDEWLRNDTDHCPEQSKRHCCWEYDIGANCPIAPPQICLPLIALLRCLVSRGDQFHNTTHSIRTTVFEGENQPPAAAVVQKSSQTLYWLSSIIAPNTFHIWMIRIPFYDCLCLYESLDPKSDELGLKSSSAPPPSAALTGRDTLSGSRPHSYIRYGEVIFITVLLL